jgi:hypothetical protein
MVIVAWALVRGLRRRERRARLRMDEKDVILI